MLVRSLILVLAFLLGAGVTIVSRLPTTRACVEAGFDVDPARHRCLGAVGPVRLREHVLGTAVDPRVFLPAGLAVGLALAAAARWDRARGPAKRA